MNDSDRERAEAAKSRRREIARPAPPPPRRRSTRRSCVITRASGGKLARRASDCSCARCGRKRVRTARARRRIAIACPAKLDSPRPVLKFPRRGVPGDTRRCLAARAASPGCARTLGCRQWAVMVSLARKSCAVGRECRVDSGRQAPVRAHKVTDMLRGDQRPKRRGDRRAGGWRTADLSAPRPSSEGDGNTPSRMRRGLRRRQGRPSSLLQARRGRLLTPSRGFPAAAPSPCMREVAGEGAVLVQTSPVAATQSGRRSGAESRRGD